MADVARLDGPFAPETLIPPQTIVAPETNVAPRPSIPHGPGRPALDSHALALMAAEACDDRKAVDIRLIGVEAISSLADWFVICSGLSDVQVRAIARSVQDQLEEQAGRLPLRQEGQDHGRWVVLDYGELIVHVLAPNERGYYDLEAFWSQGQQERYISPHQPAP